MITRILYQEEKDQYNSVVSHPIQSWEWGDFQISQGHKIYRLGIFDQKKIVGGYSVSFHTIPKTSFSIGTILRGPEINQEMITNVKKIALDENAIFVKIEPDVIVKRYNEREEVQHSPVNMDFENLKISPKVAFYPYSYVVDLNKTEEELFKSLHQKTRYNIKIANRHGVKVSEITNDKGFEIYLKLLFDTTKRQGFYLHSERYHRDLWRILKKTTIPHIFIASFKSQPLAAFMLFCYKNRLFYPYGASLDTSREVMAPNLLMWESIIFGKTQNLASFDMWGSLGPDARESESGYGFHRFKQGYGGQLVQFVGTYDLVINDKFYRLYNLVDKVRWKFLRLKAKVSR